MCRAVIAGCVLALSLLAASSYGQTETDASPACQTETQDANSVEAILDRLEARATKLDFYQCRLDYIFKQPLLESQTRRQGTLAYGKFGKRSYLRIDFNTLQYDDEPQQPHKEQFLFDGIWGTYIDHQSHSAQRQQIGEPNAPVDAFALVSRRVPVLGFSQIDDLKKQFAIQQSPDSTSPSAPSYHLHLTALPGSAYHDDYVTIDVQIDKKCELPTKIVAVTTEQDVHEIVLAHPQINETITKERFQVEIPSDFSVDTVPLKGSAASK